MIHLKNFRRSPRDSNGSGSSRSRSRLSFFRRQESLSSSSSSQSLSGSPASRVPFSRGGDEEPSERLVSDDISQRLDNLSLGCHSDGASDTSSDRQSLSGGEDGDEADLGEMERLMKKTNNVLKELLRERGLKVSGNKVDLVNCLLGLEENEDDPDDDAEEMILSLEALQKCTNKKLKAKLKSMGMPVGGTKKQLINRLLGLEPPMPKEGWDKSKDKRLLATLLKQKDEGSVRFMSAEEVHQLPPFNRWPFYRFDPNFYKLRDTVILRETIAEQDEKDFLKDLTAHPPRDLTRKGEFLFLSLSIEFTRESTNLVSIQGVPPWDKSLARILLSQDLEEAIATNTMPKAQDLYRSRPQYQVYSEKMFRDKIAQHKRYIIEPTGFVNKRNKQARKDQEKDIKELKKMWDDALAGCNRRGDA